MRQVHLQCLLLTREFTYGSAGVHSKVSVAGCKGGRIFYDDLVLYFVVGRNWL